MPPYAVRVQTGACNPGRVWVVRASGPERGRSSGVEHNLAKVGVVGSNPIARSNISMVYRHCAEIGERVGNTAQPDNLFGPDCRGQAKLLIGRDQAAMRRSARHRINGWMR
jgi:hypothetical protein